MQRDEERLERIALALTEQGLDALVCSLPSNVLMLSGYWPVIGNAIGIATRDRRVMLAVPEDEQQLAAGGWAHETRTFPTGSLDRFISPIDAACSALAKLPLHLRHGSKIGFDAGPSFDTSGYAAEFSYGASIQEVLCRAFPGADLSNASELIAQLRAVLTKRELGIVRHACAVAQDAFNSAAARITPGVRECEIAAHLKSKLLAGSRTTEHCDGFAYCMSGPNSTEACAAFQKTRSRAIEPGDFVLVHCNSYCGGFWTDITRTYCVGEPNPQKRAIIEAVLEARGEAHCNPTS